MNTYDLIYYCSTPIAAIGCLTIMWADEMDVTVGALILSIAVSLIPVINAAMAGIFIMFLIFSGASPLWKFKLWTFKKVKDPLSNREYR